jgi:hypothetical protein
MLEIPNVRSMEIEVTDMAGFGLYAAMKQFQREKAEKA